MQFIKTKHLIFIFFTISVLFSTPSFAKSNDCSFDAFTNDCKIFDNDKTKIVLPDGTFIPNFNALNSKKTVYTDKEIQSEQAEQDFSEGLEQILNEVDSGKISKKLKHYFLRRPGELRQVFRMQRGQEDVLRLQNESIVLPWPPNDSNARIQRKKFKEIHKDIWSAFSPSQQQQFSQLFTEREKNVDNLHENSLEKDLNTYTPTRKKEVEGLFWFAKEAVINTLTQGRSESELSPAEREAVKKVNSIQFQDPGSDATKNESPCNSLQPNAFYNPNNHTFTLCPNSMNLPNINLIQTIAHEIGHSIDPCYAQFGTYQINRSNLNSIEQDQWQQNYFKSNADLSSLIQTLSSNTSLKGITAEGIEDMVSNDKALGEALKYDFFTQISHGIPFSEYVFTDVYSCMIKDSAGNFRELSHHEYEKSIDLAIEEIAKNPPKKFNPAHFKDQLRTQIKKYPQCFALSSESQMGEVLADWIGVEVTAHYLQKNKQKLKSKADQLALMADFASSICENRDQVSTPSSAHMAASTIASATQINQDPHPHSLIRINQILLKHPQIQASLGCKDTGKGKYCSHKKSVSGGKVPDGHQSQVIK